MNIVYDRWGVQVFQGDCLDVMRSMPDASVSAVVTDPPAGIAFMGREWDKNRGGREQWVAWLAERMREAYRLLKPGGHALVWALPRTSHWTALALEDAGFEIRDCITHLFGTGFPKSLDVSKAIDRTLGAQREIIGHIASPAENGNAGTVALGGSWQDAPTLTAPATNTARQWSGWGTALKPGSEYWWLVRKPLAGTIASNVMEHDTGALNIDACRIPAGQDYLDKRASVVGLDGGFTSAVYGKWTAIRGDSSHSAGRWPPNVVLSHAALLNQVTGEPVGDACADGCVGGCPIAELDHQSGTTASKASFCGVGLTGSTGYGSGKLDYNPVRGHIDIGGASRFFPCFRWEAKAPSSERPMVNGTMHPTVKSLSLMRWLVRLVTPPGGTVLDCFAGTGTTGQAARAEGFPAILIEREPDAISLICARLDVRPKTAASAEGQPPAEVEMNLLNLLDEIEGDTSHG